VRISPTPATGEKPAGTRLHDLLVSPAKPLAGHAFFLISLAQEHIRERH
jgi:hypothetical protein